MVPLQSWALPPARKLHFDCVQHKLQGLTRPSTSLSGHAPLDKGAGGRVYNDDIAWLHVWRDGHSGASLHCAGFVGRGGAVALRMRALHLVTFSSRVWGSSPAFTVRRHSEARSTHLIWRKTALPA